MFISYCLRAAIRETIIFVNILSDEERGGSLKTHCSVVPSCTVAIHFLQILFIRKHFVQLGKVTNQITGLFILIYAIHTQPLKQPLNSLKN